MPDQIDMTCAILDERGNPIDNGDKTNMTLGQAIGRAVGTIFPDEAGKLSLDQQLKRGRLALRCLEEPSASLDAGEIALIEECVAKLYGPILVVRIVDMIDPNHR